jgi:hypothetical protein
VQPAQEFVAVSICKVVPRRPDALIHFIPVAVLSPEPELARMVGVLPTGRKLAVANSGIRGAQGTSSG